MSFGVSLNDQDRYDWLIKLRGEIIKREKKKILLSLAPPANKNIGQYLMLRIIIQLIKG